MTEQEEDRDPVLLKRLADTLVGTAGRTNLDRARAALDAIEEAGFKIVRASSAALKRAA